MQIFKEREREKTIAVVLDAKYRIGSDPQRAPPPLPPPNWETKARINKETLYEKISS